MSSVLCDLENNHLRNEGTKYIIHLNIVKKEKEVKATEHCLCSFKGEQSSFTARQM
jgi:hypothetical protein